MKPGSDGKFRCFVCPQSYLSRSALMRHKTQAHGSEGLQTHLCPFCPYQGSRPDDVLRRHIKTVHPTRYREVALRDIVQVKAGPRVVDSPYSPQFPEGRVVDYPKYRQEATSVTPLMSRSVTPRRDVDRTVVSRMVPTTSALKQTPTPLKRKGEHVSLETVKIRLLSSPSGSRSSITSEIGPAPQFVLDTNQVPPVRKADIATQTDVEEEPVERQLRHAHAITTKTYPDGTVERQELFKWYLFQDNYTCCDPIVGVGTGGLD